MATSIKKRAVLQISRIGCAFVRIIHHRIGAQPDAVRDRMSKAFDWD